MKKKSLIRLCKHPAFAGAVLRLINRLDQIQHKRVAIYGAGAHSADIMGVVDLQESMGSNQFEGFLSDDVSCPSTYMDFPLRPTLSILHDLDLIIISSDTFQEQMLERLQHAGYAGEILLLYPDAEIAEKGMPFSNALQADKLHLGCGINLLPSWLNADLVLTDSADLKLGNLVSKIFVMDATKSFPFNHAQMDFVFCEDFLEHFSQLDGLGIIAECSRILKPGGIWRISTPSFDVRLPRFDLSAKQKIDTSHWEWGHKLIYSYDYLKALLQQAGFTHVQHCEYGQSTYPELSNIECRYKQRHSNLIVEALKG